MAPPNRKTPQKNAAVSALRPRMPRLLVATTLCAISASQLIVQVVEYCQKMASSSRHRSLNFPLILKDCGLDFHLIVTHEGDHCRQRLGKLSSMGSKIRDAAGCEDVTAAAFATATMYRPAWGNGVPPWMPKTQASGNAKARPFTVDHVRPTSYGTDPDRSTLGGNFSRRSAP